MIHPRPNDNGQLVKINKPSTPTPLAAFNDPDQIAVVVPDGAVPAALNGIAFDPWASTPKTTVEWASVAGQANLKEPPITPVPGKRLSAGAIVIESDGRVWIVAPINSFGGYEATFPKGRLDGLQPQAAAIKEAFEESGLRIEITSLIGDFERSTTLTRYYSAKRVGGSPATMAWESQAVMLVPRDRLLEVLNSQNDHAIVAKL